MGSFHTSALRYKTSWVRSFSTAVVSRPCRVCAPVTQVPRNTYAAIQRPTDLMLHCSFQWCRIQLQLCFKEKPVVPLLGPSAASETLPQRRLHLRLPCIAHGITVQCVRLPFSSQASLLSALQQSAHQPFSLAFIYQICPITHECNFPSNRNTSSTGTVVC